VAIFSADTEAFVEDVDFASSAEKDFADVNSANASSAPFLKNAG
jgi:hypothetical protein